MTDPYADAKLVDPLAGLPVQDVHALIADPQFQNEREGNWVPPVTGSSREADVLDFADSGNIVRGAGGRIIFIGGGDMGEVSDGYHTFDELYDHRRALTAVLATIGAINGDSWKSKQHHPDDRPMFDGYFIVGIELPDGQITYHYELKHWDDFTAVPELDHAPKWDDHTSELVVSRLLAFKDDLVKAIEDGHEVVEMARTAADRVVAVAQDEAADEHPVLDK